MNPLGRWRGRMRSLAATSASLTCAAAVFSSPLAAQSSTLTLANNAITFPAPTAADYVNGYVNSTTGVQFTVDATSSGGGSVTTTIAIRSTSASLGNGKALIDLKWRRSDLVAWNTITTGDVPVETRSQTYNGTNDPWNNTIFFRMVLTWTTDAPNIYAANYRITLTVTQP
jgi:hypothetical protein